MCIGAGLAEALSTFFGPRTATRQAQHQGSCGTRTTWSDVAQVVRILQKSWRCARSSAGCEKGRTSVEVDVPDVSPDAKTQGNVPSSE